MAETAAATEAGTPGSRRSLLSAAARQRELSLVAIMVVLGALVALTAPQFLTSSNLSQVAVLASIIAVAAVGESLVILTRNVDLSVEAMIGLVAYSVALVLERQALEPPAAIALGLGLGLVLGMVNGLIVTLLRVPAIVATLGTLSIFRGIDYLVAGSHQVPLAGLPPGFTDAAHASILGVPAFVVIALVIVVIGSVILRSTRFGRQLYAVGSNPEAAAILGIPARLVVFIAFSLCGLLAGLAGVMWVIEFGTINGTSATGVVLAVVAAAVVGGVNIFGGSGTLVGAALGALFLGFIANALILVGLSQFWLQAIYGLVILLAISADAIILRRIQRATVGHRSR
ncbi:MAG: rhamnose transport system permease protein [Chloroflexota bacterium]|nr:rhamnose transport system permease protein [Chloroflexota bacterium]